MRIKIGNEWHEVTRDNPIMVELSEQDKLNIKNMSNDVTKYAIFTEDSPLSKDQKIEWMD